MTIDRPSVASVGNRVEMRGTSREEETRPLPMGFSVVLDADTVVRPDGDIVTAGDPSRVLSLTPFEARSLAELTSAPVRTVEAGSLARRLIDAGAAHPRPPVSAPGGKIAVVVPVRDRTIELDRLLAALDAPENVATVEEVIVIDDGSRDPGAIADVVARHGARLVVRAVNGGPAAARNSGLAACARDVEYVAFVDSDCVPGPGWLPPLVAHFADPSVAAVAPRIRPTAMGGPVLASYSVARFPLDLGGREALVGPGRRVGILPAAAIVVRREAVGEAPFDEDLRYGEDVDAVWRLVDAGWSVRYDPRVQVGHTEPATWSAYLTRRYHYGSCAGPLASRYPDRIAAVMLSPVPAATAVALLVFSPALAGFVLAVSVCGIPQRLRRAGVSESIATWVTAQPVGTAMIGLGRALTQAGLPLLPAALLGAAGRRRRMATLGALAVAPALRDWVMSRPPMDPVRWTLISLADDLSYGIGVWRGAVRSRTIAPLLPRIRQRRSKGRSRTTRGRSAAGRTAPEADASS